MKLNCSRAIDGYRTNGEKMRVLKTTGLLFAIALVVLSVVVAASRLVDASLRLTAESVAASNQNKSRDSEKTIVVVGKLTDEGVECPALRGDDGKLYTLTPRNLKGFKVGDRVKVVGKVAEMSFCMQGTTIVVQNITKAK
jgi:Protein of unknown function (DUF5818)